MSRYTETQITINESYLNRLRNDLNRANQKNSNWQQTLKHLENAHAERTRELQQQNQRMQQESQNLINSLQSDMKVVEQNNAERLNNLRSKYQESQNQIKSLQGDMLNKEAQNNEKLASLQNEYQEALKNETDKNSKKLSELEMKIQEEMVNQEKRNIENLDNLRENMNKVLNKQRDEYLEISNKQQNEIKRTRDEIVAIKNKDSNRKKVVQKRLEDLIKLLDDVIKNYPHQKYTPGEVDKIKNKIIRASNDLSRNDLEQSANSTIWEAYDDILKLREEIIRKEAEFEREYQAALDHLTLLLDRAKNDKLHLGKEAKSKDIRNIDYWTDNQFNNITEKLNKAKALLENKKDELEIEGIKKLQEEIVNLEEEQKATIDTAIENVIKSQNRKQIAKSITEALLKSGYQIVHANGYEGNDPRHKYEVAIKKSALADATETVVIADENEKLIINTTDHFPDEESAREEAERITKAINPSQNKVGKVSCVEQQHREEITGEKVKASLKPGGTLNV